MIGVGVAVAVILLLLMVAVVYDIARLVPPSESRFPPLARLGGRKAALEMTEGWCVGLLLRGRIDADAYRCRMGDLARGVRKSHHQVSRRERKPPSE